MNRAGYPGGRFLWVFRGHGVVLQFGVVLRFCLGGWDVSDRLEQAAMVEPVHPFEGGELDGLEAAAWTGTTG